MRVKDWTQHRLVEPSTHTALAVFLLAIYVFIEQGTLESPQWTNWLAIWAGVHAFLGLILKEGKGL